MAGIVSATLDQAQTARDELIKTLHYIQGISQGPLPKPADLNAQQIATVDAQLAALTAALAPLTTV